MNINAKRITLKRGRYRRVVVLPLADIPTDLVIGSEVGITGEKENLWIVSKIEDSVILAIFKRPDQNKSTPEGQR